ncbi:MAG: hypothetical protein IJE78_05700 [Bacteroidaceae bacterium]|nr:hypothetical protein [Bacteroidaceae bacterium]
MTDHERAVWLARLKNSIKGKYESELELQESLSRAIQLLEFQHRVDTETSTEQSL